MSSNEELLERVEILQNLLVSFATGGSESNDEYNTLRRELIDEPRIKERLPRFLRTCRSLPQFWQFIKREFGTYQERRYYLWSEFAPAIELLEMRSASPPDERITEVLNKINSETIQEVWQTSLARRLDDPDGAITAARTLVESICKFILDESGIQYEDNHNLPKLYRLVANNLELAPSQQSDLILKQVLGGVTAVVGGLGTLRNILGDAHGKGNSDVKPEVHHAELAVNLAGALSTFLISTWEASKEDTA